jgi:hypothetical protein
VLNTSEPSPVLEAEQQQLLRGMRREAAWDSQLRVAEQLAQQRLAAAARHQVLASAASLVVLPALRNGASAINGRRPKARFDELAPVAGVSRHRRTAEQPVCRMVKAPCTASAKVQRWPVLHCGASLCALSALSQVSLAAA